MTQSDRNKLRLGLDLGGTKIEIIALHENGQILRRERCDTPQGNYQATLTAIKTLVHDTEKALGRRGSVGIGTPGALSPATGLLRNSNSTCLNGKPIKEDLEQTLNRPVRIANDANCFALSEAVDGAAQGAQCVFGVIIGTGTGGGVVIRGKLLEGRHAISGEWGHNPLPWPTPDELPGPACYCGKTGCVETFLSGPGMSTAHYELHGKSLTAAEIADGAGQGDVSCQKTLEIYEDRMARSLAVVINILDPDVIVLGGGLSNIQRLYENVPQRWEKYVFSDVVNTRLVPPKHGDSSGVRGAAWLWD